MAVSKPRTEALEGSDPADTLILGFQPHDHETINVCACGALSQQPQDTPPTPHTALLGLQPHGSHVG